MTLPNFIEMEREVRKYRDTKKQSAEQAIKNIMKLVNDAENFSKFYMICEYEGGGDSFVQASFNKATELSLCDEYEKTYNDFMQDATYGPTSEQLLEDVQVYLEQILYDLYGFDYEVFVTNTSLANDQFNIEIFNLRNAGKNFEH